MLSLTLLLIAAAGVNAMIGKEVHAVILPDNNTYICADDCVFQSVYFSRTHAVCRQSEMVRPVNGQDQVNPTYPYACAGEKPEEGFQMRLMKPTDEKDVYTCDIKTFQSPGVYGGCMADRDGPSSSPAEVLEDVHWSQVKALVDASPKITDLLGATPTTPTTPTTDTSSALPGAAPDAETNGEAGGEEESCEPDQQGGTGESDEPKDNGDSSEQEDTGDSEDPKVNDESDEPKDNGESSEQEDTVDSEEPKVNDESDEPAQTDKSGEQEEKSDSDAPAEGSITFTGPSDRKSQRQGRMVYRKM